MILNYNLKKKNSWANSKQNSTWSRERRRLDTIGWLFRDRGNGKNAVPCLPPPPLRGLTDNQKDHFRSIFTDFINIQKYEKKMANRKDTIKRLETYSRGINSYFTVSIT